MDLRLRMDFIEPEQLTYFSQLDAAFASKFKETMEMLKTERKLPAKIAREWAQLEGPSVLARTCGPGFGRPPF